MWNYILEGSAKGGKHDETKASSQPTQEHNPFLSSVSRHNCLGIRYSWIWVLQVTINTVDW